MSLRELYRKCYYLGQEVHQEDEEEECEYHAEQNHPPGDSTEKSGLFNWEHC